MPWTGGEAKRHNKAATGKSGEKWSAIANSVRDQAMKDGMSEKKADAKAIRIANAKFKG